MISSGIPTLTGKPSWRGLLCGQRIVVRPMAPGQFRCKLLRRRLIQARRQQLDGSSLDLSQRLLAHVGQHQGQVEDVLDRLGIAGAHDARCRQAGDLRVDRPQHRELAEHDLVGGERDERAAGHGVDGNVDRHLARMRLDGTRDLHRRQHQAAGCMQDEIDRPLRRRLLDGGNDGLRILEIDVAGHGKSKQAALLLAMDHGDDPRAVGLLDGANGLRTLEREPPSHQQRLESHHRQQHPEQSREVERHASLPS